MEAHLDGAFSLVNPIASFNTEHAHIRANRDGTHGHRLSEDGKFALDGNEGNWIDLVVTALETIRVGMNNLDLDHPRTRPARGQVATLQQLNTRLRRMVLP